MKKLRLATVFSGIGAPEQALNKMNIPYDIVFACDNGERELQLTKEEIIEEANKKEKDINDYVKELYNNLKKINYVKKSYMVLPKKNGMKIFDLLMVKNIKIRSIFLLVDRHVNPSQSSVKGLD